MLPLFSDWIGTSKAVLSQMPFGRAGNLDSSELGQSIIPQIRQNRVTTQVKFALVEKRHNRMISLKKMGMIYAVSFWENLPFTVKI